MKWNGHNAEPNHELISLGMPNATLSQTIQNNVLEVLHWGAKVTESY